jgi:hypothetical protein
VPVVGIKPPDFNFKSINSLLESHSKDRLSSLRREFPDYPDLFQSTFKLGASGNAEDVATNDPRRTDAIRALAMNGLEVANRRIPLIIGGLSRRLRFVRALKLCGGIIAAVSSAGVISALALASQVTATITACLGFASSVTALVGEHLENPLGGSDQKGLSGYLQEILDTDKNARELALKLTAGDGDILEIAKGVNEVASNIRAVEIYSGVKT